MADNIHVLAIVGSLRRDSYNAALLRAAEEMLPEGMTLERHDLKDIPFYNGDVEAEGVPEPVQSFKSRIAAADAILIVTPEYNYSIPGVLKNAIDWASRPAGKSPLGGKPLAIMGASGGPYGTVRAQLHLYQIAAYLDMHVLNKPPVAITRAAEKFDESGHLHDEPTRELVRSQLAAFGEWTQRLRRKE